jgi:hypothetical protein
MSTTVLLSTIAFPEIRLPQRAAAQLRGFFGDYFREQGVLLHNHYADGKLRYRMPLVQYKVLNGVPTLVGLQAGATLLAELFSSIKSIQVEGRDYPVMDRDISFTQVEVGLGDSLYDYRFVTPWMALNQHNYEEYRHKSSSERLSMLGRILTANILSFYKGVGHYLPAEERLLVMVKPRAATLTGFKDNLMTAITADFTTNAVLPDQIGLGKSVSRGYGAIQSMSIKNN